MSVDGNIQNRETSGLRPYLSMWGVLALSFGYAVGWGSFVMPGRAFLPSAGPLGTLLGIAVGAIAMCLFALNYHRMVLREPGPGGAFRFARKVFGDDHGYIVAWFLCLAYFAILWANATALVLLSRYLFGDALQFGFHYTLAGFDVYLGEVALCVAVIIVAGLACWFHRKLAARLQEFLAVVFILGVTVCLAAAFVKHDGGLGTMGPAFSPLAEGSTPFMQFIGILAMMPWAFVGFEAVSNSSAEFAFPAKRLLWLLVGAVVISAAVYAALAVLPTLVRPDGYATWADYIGDLDNLDGIEAMPVFFAVKKSLGRFGVALLGGTMFAAQLTGIVGAFVATSRLMYSMSLNDVLPKWFGKLSGDGAPKNAILFVIGSSCIVPFFGRTVIGWPIDVASIGAAIAYGYTSAAAYKACGTSGAGKIFWVKASGLCGTALSILFCLMLLVPSYFSGGSLAAESYLMLAVWCIIGFLIYRHAFQCDTKDRFGRSTIVWFGVLVLIFFSSLMWVRQATCEGADRLVANIADGGYTIDRLKAEVHMLDAAAVRNSLIEMTLLVVSLLIMVNIYSLLRKREKAMVVEKLKAEEVNRTKSYFFSTVSHDIRTPLNAIIGFSQMLKMGFRSDAERDQAIDSILVSGKTLLCLINDVLDLSKLESGKMQIEPEPVACQKLLVEIVDSFRIASQKPGLEIRAKVGDMPLLMLDPQRIRQIAFNLVGNASKFTHEGHIELRASFVKDHEDNSGTFRMDVEDTGCGISEEDLKLIASPYVQVGSKTSRHGGTGLGLAICRQLAVAMGGELKVASVLGKGSTFSIVVPNTKICREERHGVYANQTFDAKKDEAVNKVRRVLVADDQKMNRMLLKTMLTRLGSFEIVPAVNGKEALALLEAPGAEPFDFVLTDMWMPEVDGEELVRKIRANPALAHLPVYVLTADVEMQSAFAEIGFTGLLLKPVTFDGLKRIIEE